MKSRIATAVLGAAACCALLATASLPAAVAGPAGLLPLAVGNRWDYVAEGGLRATEVITGTRVVRGRTVAVKSYTAGPSAGLENWWLTGPAGEVMLAGFDNAPAGLSLAYEPPITMCGGSPSLGDAWTTQVVAWDMASSAVYAEFPITFSVMEDVSLTLPAGTFHAFGVGQLPAGAAATLALSGLTLDGRLAPPALAATRQVETSDATDWFSPGVGDVQYLASALFQLENYQQPTPTRAVTWGALKQSYH